MVDMVHLNEYDSASHPLHLQESVATGIFATTTVGGETKMRIKTLVKRVTMRIILEEEG